MGHRKGIVIQEEANTVRAIPSENKGKKHTSKGEPIRRYSKKPTWLDRYMKQHSDQDLSEVSEDEDEVHPTPAMHAWYHTWCRS